MHKLWLALAIWLFCNTTWAFQAINNATYFPAVVQGHGGTANGWCGWWGNNYSTLTMNNSAKISGTGGSALDFCYSNQGAGMPTDSCDNGSGSRRVCSIATDTIQGLSTSGSNAFLSGNGSSGGVAYCNAGQNINLGSASLYQFSTLSLYSNCTVTFSADRSEYRIQKLEAGNGARLILPSGDYWIDQLILNQGVEIEVQGEVRIFVRQATQFNGAILNRSSIGSLLLFGYQDITLNGDTLINGYVYSDASLVMNNNAVINGRTTSRSLTMASSSAINDQDFAPQLTCFNDTFSSGTLSSDWVVKTSSGSFTPSIVGGRLRLTQAVGNQSTSTTYQRLFPAANNLVTISFNHYAYNGSGADGMAVVLSDATVTPQPGAFGGPLGYGFKPGIPGFAGGWLGIGFDEYGNYSGEGGSSNVGQRRQAVAIRGSGSGTSGYNYLKGTCNNGTTNTNTNCLNPRVDGNGSANHKYQITIDSRIGGQSTVKVERDGGSGYVTLIDGFNAQGLSGQSQVPRDFLLSLTGSTGGSTNIHELDNVQICALRSNPVGIQIDHFELEYSGQALTCNPETVTIKACANAACTTLITDPVTAILSVSPVSVSNGWVDGNTVNFTGGTTTAELRNNTVSAVTIGVSGSSPTTKPFSTTLCKAGNGIPSSAACTLTFADSGFIFDVPDTYSNQPQTVAIKAVKKSDVTKQCVPGFANQSKSIKFWSSYVSPASNIYNSRMSVNNSVIGTSQGNATALSLSFDAQGQSSMTVTYPDAGKVQLDARYDGTGSEAGLVMLGSDSFVARPVGLCITTAAAACTGNYASCPIFKKAGESFQVDIKAVAWESANDGDICTGNLATPNFSLSGIALSNTLVAPTPGRTASLGKTSYDHGAAANGTTSMEQSVSEVGVFRLTATPPTNGYFNTTVPPSQSQPVGRFIPADFELVSGDIVPACDPFTYMGQPFGVALDVRARNLAGAQTANYTGDFAKGSAFITAANDKDGKTLSSRLRSLQPLPWLDGRAAFTGSSEFVRVSDVQPDGPYKSLLFGLYMRDNDGDRSLIAMPNFHDGVVGDCSGGSCNARLIDTVPMQAYFGRLLAKTETGVASAALAVAQQMQYYEAGGWQQNRLDQCTLLSLASQGFSFSGADQSFDAANSELNLGEIAR